MSGGAALARRGAALLLKRRHDEAVRHLAEAVRIRPDDAFAHLHLALSLGALGRFGEARDHLGRALELRPDSAAFRIFAGRFLFDEGDYAAAEREFRRAHELNPSNDLAGGYEVLSEWALGHTDAAERLNPDELPDSDAFLARLLMLIEQDLRGRHVEYVERDGPDRFLDRLRGAFLLWRAGLLRKRGRFEEAAGLADMVMEMMPGHEGAVRLSYECRMSALEAARRRAEEDPDSAERRIELAALLAEMENFLEAHDELEKTRAMEGAEAMFKDAGVRRLRGRILYGLGRIEEALEELRAGEEPGFVRAETDYFIGLCHLARGDRMGCVERFESLVSKVCWAVPVRLREYLFWRRRPEPRSDTET